MAIATARRRLTAPTSLVLFGLLMTACGTSEPTTDTAPTAASAESGDADSSATAGAAEMTGAAHVHDGVESDGPMDVEIEVTPDAKAGANLHVSTSGFEWRPENASGDHRAGEGHAHVYVDGTKLGRLYGPWMHLALEAGDHDVRVTLNRNDHRDYLVDGATVEARQRVTVDAPQAAMATDATDPETLAAEICALGGVARDDPGRQPTTSTADSTHPCTTSRTDSRRLTAGGPPG